MKQSRRIVALAAALAAVPPALADTPAAASFDKLKALQGDWIDVDGAFGPKGKVAVTYRVTGGGNAVMETQFPGTPNEMVTIYNKDGTDVVLTHYCAAGNQPRMRAKTAGERTIAFEFDGGTNLDVSKDPHMHSGRIEFISADRITTEWLGWEKGAPSPHMPKFVLERKKSS